MQKTGKIIQLLMLLLIAVSAFSQKVIYSNYQVFGAKEGFTVYDDARFITQDNKGLLWIGSDNGLYRFDGTHFKNFRHVNNDSNSLPFNRVNFNYQDRHGVYWVYVSYYGLYNFDPGTNKFTKFHYSNENEFNINAMQLNVPFEDKKGNLWLIIPNFGLAKWNALERKFSPYKICPPNNCGNFYSASWVNSVAEDTTDNTFWLASNKGLVHFSPETGNFSVYEDAPIYSTSGISERNIFNYIFFDKNHDLWASSWDRGIQKFNTKTKEFQEFRWKSFIPDQHICTGIAEFDDNNLWVATQDEGLKIFNKQTHTFKQVKNPDSALNIIDLSNILQTSSGVLWGLNTKQLFRIRPKENLFSYFPLQQKIPGKSVAGCFCRNENILYYGTFEPGHLNAYNFTTGVAEQIKLPGDVQNETVHVLKKDTRKRMWIGSEAGIFFMNETTQKIERPVVEDLPAHFFDAPCYDILQDRDFTFWFATATGLIHYDESAKYAERFTTTSTVNKRLLSNSVKALYQDAAGNIWFGTTLGGLSCYRKEMNEVVYFEKLLPTQNVPYNCTSISETMDGKILFVIENYGLGMLTHPLRKNQKFLLFTSGDGLPADDITAVYRDNHDVTWLYTANGISVFNSKTKEVLTFEKRDGLFQNTIASSPYEDSDNNLYAGFINGFQTFNTTALLSTHNLPSSIYISTFLVNGKEQPLNIGDSIKPLKLTFKQNNLSFEFAALTPALRNDFMYAYKLDGLDKDWNYTDEKASGQYSALPPGNYQLLIKAADKSGTWMKKAFTIPIIITRPWYGTWWFYSIIILLLYSIFYVFYYYRIKQLKNVFAIRNRLAADLHDEVGSSLSSIKILSDILSNNLNKKHEVASKLIQQIKNSANSSLEGMYDIIWNLNPDNNQLEFLLSRLKEQAAPMTDAKNIQLLWKVYDIDISIKLSMEKRRDLYLVCKEALQNALKYSGCTELIFEAFSDNNQIKIFIKDNGQGFCVNEKLTAGNGLKNMRNRMQHWKGNMEFISTEKGTVVKCCMPL